MSDSSSPCLCLLFVAILTFLISLSPPLNIPQGNGGSSPFFPTKNPMSKFSNNRYNRSQTQPTSPFGRLGGGRGNPFMPWMQPPQPQPTPQQPQAQSNADTQSEPPAPLPSSPPVQSVPSVADGNELSDWLIYFTTWPVSVGTAAVGVILIVLVILLFTSLPCFSARQDEFVEPQTPAVVATDGTSGIWTDAERIDLIRLPPPLETKQTPTERTSVIRGKNDSDSHRRSPPPSSSATRSSNSRRSTSSSSATVSERTSLIHSQSYNGDASLYDADSDSTSDDGMVKSHSESPSRRHNTAMLYGSVAV